MNADNGIRHPPSAIRFTDLLGKEFAWGGRGPDVYDCYGLVIETRKRAGLPMPDDYASSSDKSEINTAIHDGSRAHNFVQLPGPRPFCLVTFRIHPRFSTHIGMVLADCRRFIHIQRRMRAGVERLDSQVWKNRITGFWEIGENL